LPRLYSKRNSALLPGSIQERGLALFSGIPFYA
jgi:hypothetical protein